jgi:hypothetical protein
VFGHVFFLRRSKTVRNVSAVIGLCVRGMGRGILMSAKYDAVLLSGLASGIVLTAVWVGFLGYEAIRLIKFLL